MKELHSESYQQLDCTDLAENRAENLDQSEQILVEAQREIVHKYGPGPVPEDSLEDAIELTRCLRDHYEFLISRVEAERKPFVSRHFERASDAVIEACQGNNSKLLVFLRVRADMYKHFSVHDPAMARYATAHYNLVNGIVLMTSSADSKSAVSLEGG